MVRRVLGHLSARWLATGAISLGLVCSGCSTKADQGATGGAAGNASAGGTGGASGASGASGSTAVVDSGNADFVKAVVTDLFPALTQDEIDQYSAKLDGAAAVALRTELTASRFDMETASSERFNASQDRMAGRRFALQDVDGGLPMTLAPLAAGAFFDKTKGEAWIDLSGVYSAWAPVKLASGEVSASIGGAAQNVQLECLANGPSVDIVILLDITSTMRSAINAIRTSVTLLANDLVANKVTGTIGIVTFQDTVGVDVQFQEASPGVERSPFFAPVPINDAAQMAKLVRFVTRLEANRGGDFADNASAAVDFARNNVIGYTKDGKPNLIGDGIEDPPATKPWPALTSGRQIFVVVTDSTFYSDNRDATNSSMPAAFKPRKLKEITDSLHAKRTVVHSADPSWQDSQLVPTGTEPDLDNDYWALQTGGVGDDVLPQGFSPTDLEALLTSETGLIDISLPAIVETACRANFKPASLAAGATVSLQIKHGTETYSKDLAPIVF
jgi:hypothetical protein